MLDRAGKVNMPLASGFRGGAILIVALVAGGADMEHGKKVFLACAACHTEKPDAVGPSLKGVFGRKSGASVEFRYSGPMRRANLTWDEANLREYIADPQAKVRGNRMPFGGLHDQNDIDDLIAYLKTLK
jgi:cytochrome c